MSAFCAVNATFVSLSHLLLCTQWIFSASMATRINYRKVSRRVGKIGLTAVVLGVDGGRPMPVILKI
jgi:hypothetical protein